MPGIQIPDRNGVTMNHSVVWTDPGELPVIFIIVKDGSTALATPDYIAGELYEVAAGDRTLSESWDVLMVKTAQSSHPEICRIRMVGDSGAAEVLIGRHIVHRFS